MSPLLHPFDTLPTGFLNKEQSLIFLHGEVDGARNKTIIGTAGCYGIRKKTSPLFTELYVSPTEPVIETFSHRRIIFWQPVSTHTAASGWMRNPLASRTFQKAIAVVKDDQYWREWSEHARRHRKKWLGSTAHYICEVSIEEFKNAFYASKKLDPLTRATFIRCVRYHLQRNADGVHLFAAKNRATEQIVAGLAVIDYPDISQSFHTISFIQPCAAQSSVGVGLIDRWYQHGLQQHIRFLNFGIVWRHGDPRAWKGFSQFKRQFHVFEYLPPRTRFKIV